MNGKPLLQNRSATRRSFLATSVGGVVGTGLAAGLRANGGRIKGSEVFHPGADDRQESEATHDARQPAGCRHRVGVLAYSFQYSIGMFAYKNRPGDKFDAARFIEATREAGGEVAQLYCAMIASLDEDGLKQLRRKANELDVMLEVHGGSAIGKWSGPMFEQTLQRAAALGAKVVGCSFGMLLRPDKIATLGAWDEHVRQCETRLRELAKMARPLGITVAVENHLDFSVEELHDLIKKVDSPNVGVMFDVGNTIGTLDDPVEAADTLGPFTVATHFKDFAIEEVTRGFRFTAVPLGCGSLRLREITQRLLKHVSPEMGLSIELMNGQQFEVKWLEDRFWIPYRNRTARQVAATLRHIRSKAIDIDQFMPVEEIDELPHEEHLKLEQDRMTRCISHLKGILADLS